MLFEQMLCCNMEYLRTFVCVLTVVCQHTVSPREPEEDSSMERADIKLILTDIAHTLLTFVTSSPPNVFLLALHIPQSLFLSVQHPLSCPLSPLSSTLLLAMFPVVFPSSYSICLFLTFLSSVLPFVHIAAHTLLLSPLFPFFPCHICPPSCRHYLLCKSSITTACAL